jgi:hypothetical protein
MVSTGCNCFVFAGGQDKIISACRFASLEGYVATVLPIAVLKVQPLHRNWSSDEKNPGS